MQPVGGGGWGGQRGGGVGRGGGGQRGGGMLHIPNALIKASDF